MAPPKRKARDQKSTHRRSSAGTPATQPPRPPASDPADQEVSVHPARPPVPTTPRKTNISGNVHTPSDSRTPSFRTVPRERPDASESASMSNSQIRRAPQIPEQYVQGRPNYSLREVEAPYGIIMDGTGYITTNNPPNLPRTPVRLAIPRQGLEQPSTARLSVARTVYNYQYPPSSFPQMHSPARFQTSPHQLPPWMHSVRDGRTNHHMLRGQDLLSPIDGGRYLRTIPPSGAAPTGGPLFASNTALGGPPVTPTALRSTSTQPGSEATLVASPSSRASSSDGGYLPSSYRDRVSTRPPPPPFNLAASPGFRSSLSGGEIFPGLYRGGVSAGALPAQYSPTRFNGPRQGRFRPIPQMQRLSNGSVLHKHTNLDSRASGPRIAQHYAHNPRPGVHGVFSDDLSLLPGPRMANSILGNPHPSTRERASSIASEMASETAASETATSEIITSETATGETIANETAPREGPNLSMQSQGPSIIQFGQETTIFPDYQSTRQPNPQSNSLGAVDSFGASMFLDAFDQALGIPGTTNTRRQKRKAMHSPDYELTQQPKPTSNPLSAVHYCGAGRFLEACDDISSVPGRSLGEESRPSKQDMASAFQLTHKTPLLPFATQAEPWQDEIEDLADFKEYLADMIGKMMYVSGETGEPSTETTGMIEEIVRQQVIEMLRSCTELAARRGSRSITINDLIFQIRHDAPKVSRLRTFLSWKDVRKNVKDSDDKTGDADLAAAEDPAGGVVASGPVDDAAKKNKKAKVGLPWEPSSFYNQEVPEREDEEDEEEEEMNYITLQRLRKADERTKVMTKEEYVTWSEFRQASFTYRKSKRFREWAGFSMIMDSKPSDDIVDILGFLTFEMVQTLTEEALKMKDHEDLLKERTGENAGTKKRKLAQGLFDPPSEGRTPVESRHIQEAFRRLQARPKKSRAMLNGTRLQQRTNLRLI